MAREQITLRLPSELIEQLRQKAQERGDSMQGTIIRLLQLALEYESSRLPPREQ